MLVDHRCFHSLEERGIQETLLPSNEELVTMELLVNTTTEELRSPNISSAGQHHWPFLSLVVIPVWMLAGNILVLLAVLCNRSLRNLSNRVITSLAFTDLLLSILVVPFGIYQLVHGQWVLGFYVCLIWTGSDVILSTTSIMHLCAIALYRYHGIAYPLRQRSTRHRSHVAALVVPAWSVAVALSVPFIVQGVLDRSHVLRAVNRDSNDTVQCGIFNRTFAVYSSLVSFFIPLSIMIFADFRSIQILRMHIRLPAKQGSHRNRISSTGKDVAQQGGVGRANDVTQFSAASSVSTVTSQTPTSQTTSTSRRTTFHSQLLPVTSSKTLPVRNAGSRSTSDDVIADVDSPAAPPSVSRLSHSGRGRSRSKSMVYINMLASCGATKVNGRERRAEKTLIWVFAAFVALWLPFFCTNLAFGLCGEGCHIPGGLFQMFSWLGYLSSGVNPCIYTLLNRDFRSAFKNLLLCRRHKMKTRNRVICGQVPALKRRLYVS